MQKGNWLISGGANHFILGQVSPACHAIDSHTIWRLRRWLCLKYRVKSAQFVRFPDAGLWNDFSLILLAPETKIFP